MILDVGSGIQKETHIFLVGRKIIHVDINREAYHLEVICDIHYLPFRSQVFRIGHASHILEHIENPCQAVRELKRVSFSLVIVKVPNALYYRLYDDEDHIYSWNSVTLENLLKQFFNHVELQTTLRIQCGYKGLRKKFHTVKTLVESAFFEPNELTAICRK